MRISLQFDYPPSANRYWRCFRNRMVPSADATKFKRHVKAVAQLAGCEMTLENVVVEVILQPKLTLKGVASGTCIDLDNALKVTLDSLQGIIYENDKQIRKIVAEYGDPVKGGGLKVIVSWIG